MNSHNQIINAVKPTRQKQNPNRGKVVICGADVGHKLTDGMLRTARSSVETGGKPFKLPF